MAVDCHICCCACSGVIVKYVTVQKWCRNSIWSKPGLLDVFGNGEGTLIFRLSPSPWPLPGVKVGGVAGEWACWSTPVVLTHLVCCLNTHCRLAMVQLTQRGRFSSHCHVKSQHPRSYSWSSTIVAYLNMPPFALHAASSRLCMRFSGHNGIGRSVF